MSTPGAEAQKKCYDCKQKFPLSYFGTRIRKGQEGPYANCPPCRIRVADRQNKYHDTSKGHTSQKKSGKSDASKRAKRRYKESTKGVDSNKRGVAIRKRRRHEDPAYKKSTNIRRSASALASGRLKSSPTFVKNTGFTSAKHFLRHLEKNIPSNMTMDDYGEGWEIEHGIPVEAYDFSNPIDIKRCWSPANVRGMAPADNDAKGVTIIDSLCMQVGVDHFPLSWGGRLLAHQEKEAFYRECRAAWNQDDSD